MPDAYQYHGKIFDYLIKTQFVPKAQCLSPKAQISPSPKEDLLSLHYGEKAEC
jgi:hypothetical protein